jgi:ketosteroid isomerase-like protein
MSEENVTAAYRVYDAFNRRDLDAVLELADDEVEVETRLVAMEGGYHGHDGVRRWWRDFLDVFPDYIVEVVEVQDLGDVTLGHLRGRGHGTASATPVVETYWQPIRWREGRCVWWRNLPTEAEALEAAGRLE